MRKFLYLLIIFVVMSVLSPARAFASSQTDVVAQFERLQAMLVVGTSRMDIQKQIVEIKLLVDKLKSEAPGGAFTGRASDLLEQVRASFLISDLLPGTKSGTLTAQEAIKEKLPELKASATSGKKKKP